jgi:hypothetical protein
MIRAVKTSKPGNPQAAQEYRSLQEFLGVTPHLAQLLAAELATFLEE